MYFIYNFILLKMFTNNAKVERTHLSIFNFFQPVTSGPGAAASMPANVRLEVLRVRLHSTLSAQLQISAVFLQPAKC